MNLYPDEPARQRLFPITKERIFLAHAGVTALPLPVADAICQYTQSSARNPQEFGEVLRVVKGARVSCAKFIGAEADEIALLGPTSLGLSLFANGIVWEPGDEVLCYKGDYPANVYPWLELRRRGVVVRFLEPQRPGEITPELVSQALGPRTRLVALASAHFLTGYRIEVDAIGQILHQRGILFSVDAIQSLGAFPLSVEHVDFLSADAHKWLLGPLAIGIVYIKKCHFELVRPTLIGAWNVKCPNFVAQEEIEFVESAQRYEPGVLNIGGVYGMKAALDLINGHGIQKVAERLLELKSFLLEGLDNLGFVVHGPREAATASSTTTFRHPAAASASLFKALEDAGVIASLRVDPHGIEYLRFSPHFYNTEAELDTALQVLRAGL